MKRFIQLVVTTIMTVATLTLTTPLVAPAGAIDVFKKACGTSGTTGKTEICGASTKDDAPSILKNVINLILIVLGMVAVIMIVIGGVRYTVSNGESSAIKGAKDTILYAVIGLLVAVMSYAIVNFVLGKF